MDDFKVKYSSFMNKKEKSKAFLKKSENLRINSSKTWKLRQLTNMIWTKFLKAKKETIIKTKKEVGIKTKIDRMIDKERQIGNDRDQEKRKKSIKDMTNTECDN